VAEKKRTPIRFGVLTALVWILVAAGIIFILWQVINRISASSLPISTATPNQTQINETIVAIVNSQLTASATMTLPADTPSSAPTPNQTPSPTLPTPKLTPTKAAVQQSDTPAVLCDQAAAGNPLDVSIPDDTVIPAGQSFVKTWKLVNNGSCTWTNEYSASFFYGDQMSAPTSVHLKDSVMPEQSIEISVEMVAPQTPGTYQGNWMLSNPGGELFVIGPNGNLPFWVRISVAASQTTPTRTASPSATLNPTEYPPTATTPEGQWTAELQIVPGDAIDLDTLTLNSGNEDLLYQVGAIDYHWLTPANQATVGVFGSQEPDLPNCQSASMSQAPIAAESLAAGTYLCYRTNQGNLGWALLVTVDQDDFALTIDFLTWIQP
jgi:hypothetical protein